MIRPERKIHFLAKSLYGMALEAHVDTLDQAQTTTNASQRYSSRPCRSVLAQADQPLCNALMDDVKQGLLSEKKEPAQLNNETNEVQRRRNRQYGSTPCPSFKNRLEQNEAGSQCPADCEPINVKPQFSLKQVILLLVAYIGGGTFCFFPMRHQIKGMVLVGLILGKAADYIVEKQEILLVRAIHFGEKIGPPELLKEVETEKVNTICSAQFLLYLAELYTERRQRSLVKWVLTRRLTLSDLEDADLDHDKVVGYEYNALLFVNEMYQFSRGLTCWIFCISAAEFIVYKLKEMGKICQEDISLVMETFKKLDIDHSGTLTASDLAPSHSQPTFAYTT
ncbi:hypothetical protein ACE6H2_012816 [Prunus campanulata]